MSKIIPGFIKPLVWDYWTIKTEYRYSSVKAKVKPQIQTVKVVSKEKTKKRIEAPSLNIVDSDDDVDYQPPAKKESNVGLFAKLPAPKNSGQSVKISTEVSKPRQNAIARKNELLKKFMKKNKEENEPVVDEEEDDDIADENCCGFFSFESNKNSKIPAPGSAFNTVNIKSKIIPNEYISVPENSTIDHENHSQNEEPSHYEFSAKPQPFVDSELKRIQGKKFHNEEVNFIEIKADDALTGNQENLLKTISEEKSLNRKSHANKAGGPSSMQKKKHQLNYLVHQAQEREIELKNMWAQNRHSRRQTQAKYGF